MKKSGRNAIVALAKTRLLPNNKKIWLDVCVHTSMRREHTIEARRSLLVTGCMRSGGLMNRSKYFCPTAVDSREARAVNRAGVGYLPHEVIGSTGRGTRAIAREHAAGVVMLESLSPCQALQ